MIERVITASADLGQSETILITNKPDEYRRLGWRCTPTFCPAASSKLQRTC